MEPMTGSLGDSLRSWGAGPTRFRRSAQSGGYAAMETGSHMLLSQAFAGLWCTSLLGFDEFSNGFLGGRSTTRHWRQGEPHWPLADVR